MAERPKTPAQIAKEADFEEFDKLGLLLVRDRIPGYVGAKRLHAEEWLKKREAQANEARAADFAEFERLGVPHVSALASGFVEPKYSRAYEWLNIKQAQADKLSKDQLKVAKHTLGWAIIAVVLTAALGLAPFIPAWWPPHILSKPAASPPPRPTP